MKRILNKAIYSVLAVCMALYLSACGQVDNGERGLYVVWGETQQDVLSEGVYFYNPFTTSLVTIDTKEKIWTETITSFSSDVQEVKITFQLAFYPQRAEIANLYKEFGGDFIDKILPPATYGVIKEVTGRYTAVDLVTKRAEVTSEISKKLQTILEGRKVVATKFDIVELDFRDEFEKAISLRVIDNYWMEHISTMSHLRDGIGLRGYANTSPLQAYTMEGYQLFDEMIAKINRDISIYLLKSEIRQNIERKQVAKTAITNDSKDHAKVQKKSTKVGRNDPCPCGSGKKYKNCCGK